MVNWDKVPMPEVRGAPRVLPVVLLCHATVEWCGRLWVVNTPQQYQDAVEHRLVHQTFCETTPHLKKVTTRYKVR